MLFRDGFANKALDQRELYVKVLPRELDEEVASLMVKGFGGTLTKINEKSTKYIGISDGMPFKDKNYKY